MDNRLDLTVIKALAEQGDANAQYEYGWALCCDDSTQENRILPLYWFNKAAEQGHPKALWRIGSSYEMVDDERALYWYRKSAEAGYPIAQWWLGVKYERGEGVTQDFEQAFFWYEKAAEAGDVDACRELGAMYEAGNGVKQDWQQSAYWYKNASIRYSNLLRETHFKQSH